MTTVSVTVLAAVSAIGLAAVPIRGPRPVADLALSRLVGGKADTLVANPKATALTWTTADRARSGSVQLEDGLFVIRHEKLTSGSFTLDMRKRLASGSDRDAAPSRGGPRADIDTPRDGNAARFHPRAYFTSSGAERIGPARWRVAGTLVLNDVSRPVSLDVDVRWPETGHMVATSTFALDPRAFGARLIDDVGRITDAPVQVALSLDAQRKTASVVTR